MASESVTSPKATEKVEQEEDEDLEEGELKDDDDDDDDDDEDENINTNETQQNSKRLTGYSNDNSNNSGLTKEPTYGEGRNDSGPFHNYPPHHGGPGSHPPQFFTHHQNRRPSPGSQHHADMHDQYPPYPHHQFGMNANNNHYMYPLNDGPLQAPPIGHHPPFIGPPGAMYPRGGHGNVGPIHKVNIRCRFYSKTSNKCTWGDHCRFEHRDDSPGPEFDRLSVGPGGASSTGNGSRGPPTAPQPGPPLSVGGGAGGSPGYLSPSSSSSAVVYERKHRLAYELAPWNDRPYPPQPPPSKYDRGDPGYPPGSRGFYRNHHPRDPAYGREPPPHMGQAPSYGRELPQHMGPAPYYSAYPSYPAPYRAGPVGPHATHYNKFMSSSQRTVPPDSRRSRSNKRGHDEDESSWSDSGSEDSILGQANYRSSNTLHANLSKTGKQPTETTTSDEPLEQGSGTPPGEPLPEDRERQEMLLNKLKEVEDLMARKKGEQEDPQKSPI